MAFWHYLRRILQRLVKQHCDEVKSQALLVGLQADGELVQSHRLLRRVAGELPLNDIAQASNVLEVVVENFVQSYVSEAQTQL